MFVDLDVPKKLAIHGFCTDEQHTVDRWTKISKLATRLVVKMVGYPTGHKRNPRNKKRQRHGCFQKKWYPQIIHFNEFSLINHPFWGTPILETPV